MLLANIALGLVGTMALAGAYTFHDGVMSVQSDNQDGHHIHVWVPAAIVPMAMRVVPQHKLEHASRQVQPWLPTLRALTKELEKYPEAVFVDIREGRDQHVEVRTQGGKLLIDVDQPDEHVHVACPLAMIRDVAYELEAHAPGV